MIETAFAKINLALHVRQRRDDGYHEIETLFAFVDGGDRLSAVQAGQDSVSAVGEFAGLIDDPFGNIVAKALGALRHGSGWKVTLEKNLPVAAGLGGGSADAGAVFRMVEREYGLPEDWRGRAASLGADVPACVLSRTCIGRGTGTELEEIESDLAGSPVLLVNPRVPLATGLVFEGWDGVDRGPMPTGTVREIALAGRNDLEPSAIAQCPVIADVLAELTGAAPLMARMSGSGATCFALFETARGGEGRTHPAGRVPSGLVDDGRAAAVIHEAYRLLGTPRFGGILVVADHASNHVPDGIELGIDAALLEQHIAVDIGVAGVAARMAQHTGTAALLGNVSRLGVRYQPARNRPRRHSRSERWPCHSRQHRHRPRGAACALPPPVSWRTVRPAGR